MTRNTKIYFIIMLCVAILCSIMGMGIRNSYTGYHTFAQMEKAENLQKYVVQLEENDLYENFSTSIENYDDLEKASDLIAKVSATKERTLFFQTTTKTKVTVEEVWKGDAEPGQSIYIYEPVNFSYFISKDYCSIGGYQIMKEGEEYYVFLQKLKTSEGYQMSEKEKNTYLPSTASYSKFPVRAGEVKVLDKNRLDDDKYSYGEIQNMEIITSEQKILSTYNKIKEASFTYFRIFTGS